MTSKNIQELHKDGYLLRASDLKFMRNSRPKTRQAFCLQLATLFPSTIGLRQTINLRKFLQSETLLDILTPNISLT